MAEVNQAGVIRAGVIQAGVIQAGADKQAEAVLAGITELLPVFRQRAQEAEDGRVVPAESVKALAETGFFRLLQPASFGGLEADPVTFFTAVPLIASACGSTGWVASVVGVRTLRRPASDGGSDDVWDTVGLRGTGSNDIVVDGAFVPEHRSLSFTNVTRCACPGQQVNAGPLYRVPFGSIFSYAITTPIIGMATGAYAAHVEYQRGRVRASYAGQKAAEDPFGQVRIAEAAALLDAAWAALERNMAELMTRAQAGEKLPLPLRLRVRRDQVTGTGQAIRAVDLLFENSGGRALRTGTPIQRFWRDAHAGRVHAINDPERALSMFGRGEFGLDVGPDAMV